MRLYAPERDAPEIRPPPQPYQKFVLILCLGEIFDKMPNIARSLVTLAAIRVLPPLHRSGPSGHESQFGIVTFSLWQYFPTGIFRIQSRPLAVLLGALLPDMGSVSSMTS